MACLPGMPCYGELVKIVYPKNCDPCLYFKFPSSKVNYDGPNLSCSGVQTGDCLNTVLEKIDTKICSEELVAQIIQTIDNNEVLKAYFCQLVSSCSPTTTTTSTTATPTTTTTTTTLQIIIPECSTFITSSNSVQYYNFETNSFTYLFSEGFGSWVDIANTNDKLWITSGELIKEYDITFNPWTASFNRDIIINSGPGLTANNNNLLVGSLNNKIISIDISGPTPTYLEIATLPSFGGMYSTTISGDLLLTSNNKLICTTATYTDGPIDYYYTRLLQYDFITMDLELVIDLYPTITAPYGLSENNGNIYIFCGGSCDKLFSISPNYPYNITEVETLSVSGASVEKSCATSSFITTTTTTSSTTTAAPTTTTTTTTINCSLGLEEYNFMTQIYDSEDNLINIQTTPISEACALLPGIHTGQGASFYTVYMESLAVGQNVIFFGCFPLSTGTYALYNVPIGSITTFIAVVDGVITEILDCSSTTTTTTTVAPTTTTTTTTIACATPTLNSATSDGFGNITLDYNLNGSTLCTYVGADYSEYSNFLPFSFGQSIPDGCNQTSYVLTLNTASTRYIRVSMICDGVTLYSNIISVIPGTTTTTTTIP